MDSSQQPLSLARRHFLGLTAAAAGRAAGLAAMASTVLPSSAEAANGGNGNHNGWSNGWGNGGNGNHFGWGNGGGGGPNCFLKGTHLLTSRGEVCIEDLRIGDLVET